MLVMYNLNYGGNDEVGNYISELIRGNRNPQVEIRESEEIDFVLNDTKCKLDENDDTR